MGDAVAYTLDLVHQPLDLVEHAVDGVNEAIEIPDLSAGRQALRKIAADDALDGPRDGVDAAQRADTRHDGAPEPGSKREQCAPCHGTGQRL